MKTSFLPAVILRRVLVISATGLLPVALPAQTAPAAVPASEIVTRINDGDPLVDMGSFVITATRTASNPKTLGSAAERISADSLALRQQDTLAGALAGTPGAPLFSSGGRGAITSLFLRGANSNQVLFLVDGIRFSDANADYGVTLGGASLGAGDAIEIVRGPQSTLHGGEAIGGVVAIVAERGEGETRTSVSTEAGSFGGIRGSLASSGASDAWGHRLNLHVGHTDNARDNNEFDSAGANVRIDRRVSARLSVGATARWFHGKYSDPGDRFTNDPDDSLGEDNVLVTVFADAHPAPGWSVHTILGAQDRRLVSDASNGTFSPNSLAETTNRRGVLDAQVTFRGWSRHRVTGGLTAEATHTRNTGFGAINRRQESLAFFIQDEFNPTDTVHITAGLRSDDFDTFGRSTTGRASAAWQVVPQKVKLRASYGTGFRSPSFLDLYAQSPFFVGNPSLRAERARGWDAGVDLYDTPHGVTASLTWFENRFSDLIAGDFTAFPSTVGNVSRARSRGVEFSAQIRLLDNWDARASYTYLDAHNLGSGSRLLRRPRHSASADLSYDFRNGLSAGLGAAAAADRRDIDALTFATIEAENFTVLRAHAAWRAGDSLTLRLRLENLLDEDYEPVYGYPATGFGAFAGAEWRW